MLCCLPLTPAAESHPTAAESHSSTAAEAHVVTRCPQNNLAELWSLLNFLLPDVFSSLENFESW